MLALILADLSPTMAPEKMYQTNPRASLLLQYLQEVFLLAQELQDLKQAFRRTCEPSTAQTSPALNNY